VGCVLIVLVWFVARVIWAMTRARARRCPACDRVVRSGAAVCAGCGLELAAVEAANKPAPSW
jgi:predicted amidophosphoribosyltransferase